MEDGLTQAFFTGALYPDLARNSREKSDKTSNVCGPHASAPGKGRDGTGRELSHIRSGDGRLLEVISILPATKH